MAPPRASAAGVRFKNTQSGEAHGHQRRLRVGRKRKLRFRSLEHQPRELLAKRRINFLKHAASHREIACERLAHPDRLRSLPRKDKSHAHVALSHFAPALAPVRRLVKLKRARPRNRRHAEPKTLAQVPVRIRGSLLEINKGGNISSPARQRLRCSPAFPSR